MISDGQVIKQNKIKKNHRNFSVYYEKLLESLVALNGPN